MSTETLCSHEWDKYLKTTGKAKKGWELIMDDFRNVNVHSQMATFLEHFANLMENLFLGSATEVMSDSVRKKFVDVTVERMKELIDFDYKYTNFGAGNKIKFYQVTPLMRSTEDTHLKRKTEMILMMVVRITKDEPKAHIETSIKVRIRSIKDST